MDKGITRRDAILQAAREHFARRGYAGTSMRRIAEQVGITKAALYYHFRDKASLFREATEDAVRRRRERVLARLVGIDDPCQRLRRMVHAYLEEFVAERALSRRLYSLLFLPEDAQPWIAELCRDFGRPMGETLEACARTGCLEQSRVEEVKVLLMGGIEYLGALWLLDPQSPAPTCAMGDRLLAQLVPGVFERKTRSRRPSGASTTARTAGPRASTPRSSRRSGRARRAVLSLAIPVLLGGTGPALCAAGSEGGSASPAASGSSVGAAARVELAPVITAIPGATPLNLEQCVQRALEANAALRAEREGRGELKGQMYQALATGLPSIDASGTWNRGRDPSFALDQTFGGGFGGAGDSITSGSAVDSVFAALGQLSFIPDPENIPAQTFWRTSLNAHWDLNPALVLNAVRAAGLGIDRQEMLIRDRAHRTVEEVMNAYYGVIRAGEYLEALDADLAARREFLEVTRRRFHLGLSTPLDTLRAAVSLANLVPQRRSTAQDLRDAGSALNVAMGRDPLAPIGVQTSVAVERAPVDPDVATALVHRRPDLRSLALLERIQRKNRGAQKAGHRPSLSANAAYGYVTSDLADMFDEGHDFWSASLSLTVPLFDGLQTRGNVQEVEATIRRIGLEYEQALRQARLEVLSLHGSLEAARENLTAAQLNLTAAEDARDQVNLRYELGKADYLSVLDVQADWLLARSNYIQARNEVLTLTASLKRALGFSPDVSLSDVVAMLNEEYARLAESSER